MHEVAAAVAAAHRKSPARLALLTRRSLLGPSLLPGWSRLTVLCHLRYGASALLRMTAEALAGEPTSYYPEGRAAQRPGTLGPQAGESVSRRLPIRSATSALRSTLRGHRFAMTNGRRWSSSHPTTPTSARGRSSRSPYSASPRWRSTAPISTSVCPIGVMCSFAPRLPLRMERLTHAAGGGRAAFGIVAVRRERRPELSRHGRWLDSRRLGGSLGGGRRAVEHHEP